MSGKQKRRQTELPIEQAEFCANPRCLLSNANRGPDLNLVNNSIGERVNVAGHYFCRTCVGAALVTAMAEGRWLREFQVNVSKATHDAYGIDGTTTTVDKVRRSLIDDALEATAVLIQDGSKEQVATAFLKLLAVMESYGWTFHDTMKQAGALVGLKTGHPLPDTDSIQKILSGATTAKKLSEALNRIKALSPRFKAEVHPVREVEPAAEGKPAVLEYLVKVRME